MLLGSTGQDVFEVESKGLVINCYLLGPGNMDSTRWKGHLEFLGVATGWMLSLIGNGIQS